MRRLLVAEPTLVPRSAHLLLVTEPLQVLGRDVYPRAFGRRGGWLWGFGGHEAILPVLTARPARRTVGLFYIVAGSPRKRHGGRRGGAPNGTVAGAKDASSQSLWPSERFAQTRVNDPVGKCGRPHPTRLLPRDEISSARADFRSSIRPQPEIRGRKPKMMLGDLGFFPVMATG